MRVVARKCILWRVAVIGGLSLLAFHVLPASAEEGRKGHGHASIAYQYISVDGFKSSIGTLDVGTTDTHSLFFQLDYNVTDRLSLFAGLPLIRKRYQGPSPHRVAGLDPPNNSAPFIDHGGYHTDWQDFRIGGRYLARSGVLEIEPYVGLEIPSNDYPFYGASAVGQNVNRLDLGAHFTYVPPISDAFYQLEIGYVFVEKTLGVNIDHWLVNGSAGYFFGPRLSGRVFFLLKKGHGLKFPDDFPLPRTGEHWYQHDRMVRHNYMNVGVGLDWALNDKYALSTSVMTMAWAEQVFIVDYATNVTLTRSF